MPKAEEPTRERIGSRSDQPADFFEVFFAAGAGFAWADRPTALRPPHEAPFVPGTVTELQPQAQADLRTLAARLARFAAFLAACCLPAAV